MRPFEDIVYPLLLAAGYFIDFFLIVAAVIPEYALYAGFIGVVFAMVIHRVLIALEIATSGLGYLVQAALLAALTVCGVGAWIGRLLEALGLLKFLGL
jgi:hypothetical protein